MARIALPPVMPITALSGQWEERHFAWTRAHREIEAGHGWIGYLKPKETAVITKLGGGVSNGVFEVESSKGAVVFEQALAKRRG